MAAYHAEANLPIVRLLLCDDAPPFNWIAEELALCWVHEGRHYKKLMPSYENLHSRWAENAIGGPDTSHAGLT